MITALAGCQKIHSSEIGAPSPWVTYEAEQGRTNGNVHGPSTTYLTPESEASGRKLVKLDKTGQHIEFTTTQPANTIVVRFCTPDAPEGGGADSTLSLYIGGKFEKKLQLSSRYSWIYGDFPWSNDPGKGKPHRFFDECHTLIRNVAPGETVRLQKDPTDTADYYLIDFIELEQIAPPLPQPPNSLSIVDFGVTPNDGKDAYPAFIKCMEAARAQGKSVWIPEGEFPLNGPRINIGPVKIQGAGMWYSRLTGTSPMFEGTGATIEFSNLALFGNIDRRVDNLPENAFNGNFGKGSVFKNLWIEHFKCGFWTAQGTEEMLIENCRIRNLMADGVNFCGGTSYSKVTHCHLRNTGDDALATWSPAGNQAQGKPCVQNSFINNTIQNPWLANCIAIYGGTDHLVARNLLSGTVFSGSGILVSSGFLALPLAGTIQVEDNIIKDTGGDCYIGETVGALWIHAKDSDIDALISIRGTRISGSPSSGVTLHGPKAIKNLTLHDTEISGVLGHGIEVKSTAAGALHTTALKVRDSGLSPVHNGSPEHFSIQTK